LRRTIDRPLDRPAPAAPSDRLFRHPRRRLHRPAAHRFQPSVQAARHMPRHSAGRRRWLEPGSRVYV